MRKNDFYNSLLELGIPVAYGFNKVKTAPPFLVYALPSYLTQYGDNGHFFDIPYGWAEIYTDNMDEEFFRLQEALEGILSRLNLPWSKENETYVDSERMALARYNFYLI